MFDWLKQTRRIATRYGKADMCFLGFLNLATGRVWLSSFVDRF